jgi:hypothetical protein
MTSPRAATASALQHHAGALPAQGHTASVQPCTCFFKDILHTPCCRECGWTGVVVRPLASEAESQHAAGPRSAAAPPQLEVAVARQRTSSVAVYRDGQLLRQLYTIAVRVAAGHVQIVAERQFGALWALSGMWFPMRRVQRRSLFCPPGSMEAAQT